MVIIIIITDSSVSVSAMDLVKKVTPIVPFSEFDSYIAGGLTHPDSGHALVDLQPSASCNALLCQLFWLNALASSPRIDASSSCDLVVKMHVAMHAIVKETITVYFHD